MLFTDFTFRSQGLPLENYIVRIYRRDQNKPDEIVGLVELVEAEKKQAFRNMDELSQILCCPVKKKTPRRNKSSQKKSGDLK